MYTATTWSQDHIVEIAGLRVLARVVAFEHEAILGRDLLNRLVALLDGPRRSLALGRAARRR